MLGMLILAVTIFWLVKLRFRIKLRLQDYILLLCLSLSVIVLIYSGISYTNLPAIGLLTGMFYGSIVSVTLIGMILLVSLNISSNLAIILSQTAGAFLSSLMVERLNSREEIAFFGLAVGLTQGSIYLLIKILIGAVFGPSWYLILQEAALFSFSGLVWYIIGLGLSPYLESIFNFPTTTRLTEACTHPILMEFIFDNSDIFQKTMLVKTLAESSASSLSCNLELVRAGAFFLDIGQINTLSINHVHNFSDPWQKANMMKNHIREGRLITSENKLPKAIQDLILEHHGNLLMTELYQQAQQQSEIPVKKSDFCYDGPIPQSRESGILMLADYCVTVLLSLEKSNCENIGSIIKSLINNLWQDNQLKDSGLKYIEMTLIAKIFEQEWKKFNHKRLD